MPKTDDLVYKLKSMITCKNDKHTAWTSRHDEYYEFTNNEMHKLQPKKKIKMKNAQVLIYEASRKK